VGARSGQASGKSLREMSKGKNAWPKGGRLCDKPDDVGDTVTKRIVPSCPYCRASLKPGQVLAAGQFPCPDCGTLIQASTSYAAWLGLGNVLFSLTLAAFVGLRGLHLLYAVALAWLPVQFLAINLVKYILPPRIEVAPPWKSLRQTLREIKGPTELNLRGTKPPSRRGENTK